MSRYGSAKSAILSAGQKTFEKVGFDDATVASICALAGASNGSFFHFFGSKKGLAAELFFLAIRSYHLTMLAPLVDNPDARTGVAALVVSHLNWVVENRRDAQFMFEQARADWLVDYRKEQKQENEAFRSGISNWFDPLVAAGRAYEMPSSVFLSQIIGPAQIFCRAWLSGRDRGDPRRHAETLTQCAIRSIVIA
jgi:AcrR family transcriptional regulator